MAKKTGPKFYAVRKGLKPGVYMTWRECEAQVKGFRKAEFRSFETRQEAMGYIYRNQGQQLAFASAPATAPAARASRVVITTPVAVPSFSFTPASAPAFPRTTAAAAPPPASVPSPASAPPPSGSQQRKLYAVAIGVRPGIYYSWDECAKQVKGFPGCYHKSAPTPEEALAIIEAKNTEGIDFEDPVFYAVYMPSSRSGAIFLRAPDALDAQKENPESVIHSRDTLAEADAVLCQQIVKPPVQMSQSYLSIVKTEEVPDIDLLGFDEGFKHVASSQGLVQGSAEWRKVRTMAIGHEFLFLYGPKDPHTGETIAAEFLEPYQKLEIYQAMCRDVGIKPRENIELCISDLKTLVLVNIIDFIDARRLDRRVKTWPLSSWEPFRRYTLGDDKRLHRESAMEYGGFLAALLQDFRRGPGLHKRHVQTMGWFDQVSAQMKRRRVC